MSRLTFNDTMQDALVKISEGNPGALTVCVEMLTRGAEIDPQAIGGGLISMLMLDELEIYGSRIWMLYKDVCGENLSKVFVMMRSHQLGFINKNQLIHAIDNYGDGIDLDDLCNKVTERLEEFRLQEDPVNIY